MRLEQGCYEVDGVLAQGLVDVAGDLVVAVGDFSIQFLVGLPSIWETSAQDGEQQDTQGPDVGWRSTILSFIDDLWSHI